MHSSSTQQSLKILNATKNKGRILDLVYATNACLLLLLVLNPFEANAEENYFGDEVAYASGLFMRAYGVLSVGLILYGWHQAKRDLNLSIQSMDAEVARTKKHIDSVPERIWRESRNARLDCVITHSTHPHSVIVTKFDKDYQTIQQFSWKVGRRAIAENMKKLDAILEAILMDTNFDANILSDMYMLGLKSVFKAIFKKIEKGLPYKSFMFDWPTKVRIMNFVGLLALSFYISINNMLMAISANTSSEECQNMDFVNGKTTLFLAAALYAMCMLESHIMRTMHRELNLEGFTNLNKPYLNPKSLTCIGQQLTEQLVFYPSNKTLNDALDKLSKGRKFLEQLDRSPESDNLSATTRAKIDNFYLSFKKFQGEAYQIFSQEQLDEKIANSAMSHNV